MTATLQFVYEGIILASLGIWVAYCASARGSAQARDDAGEFDNLPLE